MAGSSDVCAREQRRLLVDASRGATLSETTPVVLADAGVEKVNAQVDDGLRDMPVNQRGRMTTAS